MGRDAMRCPKAVVIATTLAISALGQAFAQTERGALEIGIGVGPFMGLESGGSETIGVLGACGEPHLDFFVSAGVSIGVAGVFFHSLESSESGLFFAAAYASINYYFASSSSVSPYIGGRIGVLTPVSNPLFGLGPEIGLKWSITRGLAVTGELAGAVHVQSEGTVFATSLTFGLAFYL